MPFITSQPSSRQDVPASVLEANAIAVTLANEWENEWNQSGLASRLSKEVGACANQLYFWVKSLNKFHILVGFGDKKLCGWWAETATWFCLFKRDSDYIMSKLLSSI